MKKRCKPASLLLTVFLVFAACLGASAEAVTGNWEYKIREDGAAIITRYLGTDEDVDLNWNLQGHLVAEIGEEAFAGNESLKSIQLPIGVTIIRQDAFRDCVNLTDVGLPSMLEIIEDGAFVGCISLAELTLPDSLMECGEYWHDENTKLITGPEGETNEPGGYSTPEGKPASELFQYRISNGEVTITSYIGNDYEVTVPAEIEGYPVTTIGANAFENRYEVETVFLPEGLKTIGRTAFRFCTCLAQVELPSTLETIDEYAFFHCEYLPEIVIPEGVTTIGKSAFQFCSLLKRATLPASLQKIPMSVFKDCHRSLTICAPKGSAAQTYANNYGYKYEKTED